MYATFDEECRNEIQITKVLVLVETNKKQIVITYFKSLNLVLHFCFLEYFFTFFN